MSPLYIILFIFLTLLVTTPESFTITDDIKNSIYALVDNRKKTAILTVDADTKTVKTTDKDATFAKLTTDTLTIPNEKKTEIKNGKLSNLEIKELTINDPDNIKINKFGKFSNTYVKRYGSTYPAPLWSNDYWAHRDYLSIMKSMQHGVSCIEDSSNNSVYVPRGFWFSAWPGNKSGGKTSADANAFQFLPVCNKISIG